MRTFACLLIVAACSGCVTYKGPGVLTYAHTVDRMNRAAPPAGVVDGVKGFVAAWWSGLREEPMATVGNLVVDGAAIYYAAEGVKRLNSDDDVDYYEQEAPPQPTFQSGGGNIYYIGGDGSITFGGGE